MVSGIHRSLRASFPELVDLDLQGIDIPVQAVFAILPHLKKLQRFHFHAIDTHSPSWRDTFRYTGADEKMGMWRVSREELEAFTVECTSCVSVEIAICTLIECVQGKDVWADALVELNGA